MNKAIRALIHVVPYDMKTGKALNDGVTLNPYEFDCKAEFIRAVDCDGRTEGVTFKAFITSSNCDLEPFFLGGQVNAELWDVIGTHYDRHAIDRLASYLDCELYEPFTAGSSLVERLERSERLFFGRYDTARAFAKSWFAESSELMEMPLIVADNIDFDGLASDLLADDFIEANGNYFYAR